MTISKKRSYESLSKTEYIKILKRLQTSLGLSSNMTFAEYQEWANKTGNFNLKEITTLYYVTLGLTGEAGEVAEKVKKILRNQNGKITQENINDLILELGDVLWYMSQMARILGADIGKVALFNILKLQDRKRRKTLKSTGDTR